MHGSSQRSLCALLLVVLIVGCASAPEPSRDDAASPSKLSEAVYLVRRGDSLSAISRRFFVSLTELQRRNAIANPNRLRIGQRLIMPRKSGGFAWPLALLDISSDFGSPRANHQGVDLRAARGTPIRAAAAGRVRFSGRQNGYGNVVILQHADNTQTLYAHTERNAVKVGQRVGQGQVIATVGNSGNATGYHLHFEFIRQDRKLNPRRHVG